MTQSLYVLGDGFGKYDLDDSGALSSALVIVVVVFVSLVAAWALWMRRGR